MMSTFSSTHTALAAPVGDASQTPTAPGGKPALGDAWQPFNATDAAAKAGSVVPGQVLLQLASGTTVTTSGGPAPKTSSTALNSVLNSLHTKSLRPLGNGLVLAEIGTAASTTAATRLAAVPGVAQAEPDRYVTGMSTPAIPLPASIVAAAARAPRTSQAISGTTLPSNYGLTSSLESWLNAGGVNAMGAYQELADRYGQLPGTGEIITNVSIGDLTDQSMADAGDRYVKQLGPTTIISNGQRYLDLPSMPLIPTWTADASGRLDPTGSTEHQDQADGEIMLDFSLMAPLPHDQQRPDATGNGATDLLGIAPGASYRLVVPSQPTADQIATALLAAAQQTPHPTVINASLGFGTDVNGFPGRDLEDDPLLQSTVATIVHQYGITVVIAANDGTRLFTPTSVGPDGGSTPTDVTRDPARATNINDDANSTTPSEIMGSGAITAGGTTTDDTLAAGLKGQATVAETRISGAGNFSSGFGSRVNLSAPSDNIPAFVHAGSTAQSVLTVLNGGTSASAPEIAAAAAVVHQVGRLTGRQLTPDQIRSLLERTGRPVATPAQIDRTLQVGPQLNLTAAVDALIPGARDGQNPQLIRLSVAHRETISGLGGTFIEATDQSTIDLTDEGLVGPVTFAADLIGSQRGDRYQLTVGSTRFRSETPSIRVTPTQLLTAAGLPVVSTGDRSLTVTFDVLRGDRTVASLTRTLTLSASDGTFTEAPAPTIAPVVLAGHDVTVHYDLSGVRNVFAPALVVSTVGHWNPVLAPIFNLAWSTPLTATSGTVTIPASAFATGGGIYGVGLIQDGSIATFPVFGEFAPVRIAGFDASDRPNAPTVATPGQASGHYAMVTHAAPDFTLHYSVDGIRGASGAILEVSAPAPTIFNSLNTFTAQNGTVRDNDNHDGGSVVYQRLPGTAGSVQLSAITLGLANTLQYNVRVLPVDDQGNAVGQDSPSSALLFDDGIVPGNGIHVLSFASAGSDSTAVATDASGGSAAFHYNPATGSYGAAITSIDPSPNDGYNIVGVDAKLHRVLLAHLISASATINLETWDLTTNTEVGQPIQLAFSQYEPFSGRVDQIRHRAAMLVHVRPGNADEVLPIDLTTGRLGAAIPLDAAAGVAPGFYDTIDLDQTTGHVQVVQLARHHPCFGSQLSGVLDVNLDSSTVTASNDLVSRCGIGFADDQQGGKGWVLLSTTFSLGAPSNVQSALQPVDEQTLVAGDSLPLRTKNPPVMFAVDGVHQLALVAYRSPFLNPGNQVLSLVKDSNAMSQIDVVDLTTGAVLNTISTFNFNYDVGKNNESSIQLDPSTRTGWTFGPYGAQIQSFHY